MAISGYSTTAASNTASPPNGLPIGTTKVSQYDDVLRQVMADIRSWYETPQWRDLGHTPTRTGNTTFTIANDVTVSYIAGQRIRCTDSSTLYGTIASSSYGSPNTTVTVTLDSGNLSASLTAVAVGIDPTNDAIAAAALSGEISTTNLPAAAIIPSGSLMPYAGSSVPTGWLICGGQAVSRTTYAALFTAISTTYGTGDGSTTFNLPDLRGRVIAGVDNMNGSAANRITNAVCGITGTTLGAVGGDQNMHQHTHTATVTDPGHIHAVPASNAGGSGFAAGSSSANAFTHNTSSATTGVTVSNANAGSGASQNVQPSIIMNYIIKT